MPVNIGQKAPDFTLLDMNFKPRSLQEFVCSQNVVLVFFPAAFSSVCTKEMCTFRDSMTKLNSLKANVIGISVDTPFAQKAFAEHNKLNFTLLSDFNKEVIKLYDVVLQDLLGLKELAKRAVFIIDKEGIVRYKWVSDDPKVEPNYNEIIKELERIG
ncbi:MAG: peroxiredoxin [Thermoprotei archaeon]|jgi:peroxiredoxin